MNWADLRSFGNLARDFLRTGEGESQHGLRNMPPLGPCTGTLQNLLKHDTNKARINQIPIMTGSYIKQQHLTFEKMDPKGGHIFKSYVGQTAEKYKLVRDA